MSETGAKEMVPAIRFKGFNGDWAESELENEVLFYSGLTYSPANIVSRGGTLVLRSSNVKGGDIVTLDNVYVNSEVVNCDNVRVGDIIIVVRNGSRSLIGKHAQIKKEMENTVIGAFMTGIHTNQPEFINALLNTEQFNAEIEKNLGATINQITTGAFKKMVFSFTNSEEQTKIGEYFQELDALIAGHRRKREKLLQLKKSLLEKMFPKQGQGKPEIRFVGFDEDWGEKCLENVVLVNSGRDYKHLKDGDIPVYGTGGYMLSVDEALSENFDAIGIGRKGTIDRPYVLKAPFWTVDTLFYCVPNEGHELNFVYGVFQRIRWKLMDESTGVPSLSKVAINGIDVKIPKSAEQTKIGELFKHTDTLINQHQAQIKKLLNIKQACLAKMFV